MKRLFLSILLSLLIPFKKAGIGQRDQLLLFLMDFSKPD
jgi:hypothetical protein